jgi:4-carboxymuconolactone decarboxylase
MSGDLKTRTQRVAGMYFKGVTDEKPFELWKYFDPETAKELSLFITGQRMTVFP